MKLRFIVTKTSDYPFSLPTRVVAETGEEIENVRSVMPVTRDGEFYLVDVRLEICPEDVEVVDV